ncbi:hypothetical protein FA13DRAFT_1902342 [Coprinellus micaceus]|uniref:Outer spore wall protein RRT8 n=1 Tax=Coprinellus micaceus TaxID=71717 RepID=A0A4Y7TPC4_COPMI|nr:hypothetical protein FA13DRAFT_1902342 [Coprinellus micaceus]
MAEAIINEAKAELSQAISLTNEAIFSGAWYYPLLGVHYVASHPTLYKAVYPILTKALITSVGITGALFFFTWLPQLALCAVLTGPLAFIPATLMVLAESYLLVIFISRAFFLSEAQDKIFDAVLLQRGNVQLVEAGREVTTTGGGVKKLGKSLSKPLDRFSPQSLIRYLVTMPLNAIPFLGTTLFLLYNGKKLGPTFHGRYFQLKRFSSQQKVEFIEKRRAAYTAFGATALVLNMIPIAGFAFNLTSTVGAALWAGKLEQTGGQVDGNPKDERPGEIERDATKVEL